MIIDVTGTILTPGNFGDDCLGNGEKIDRDGHVAVCCCDECDYVLCCTSDFPEICADCTSTVCPRKEKRKDE